MLKNRGTTLIEIMIALFILATAMIPIASIMGYGGRATSKDARRILAIQLLDKTLRQMLQTDYDKIPTGKNIQKGFEGIALGDVTSGQDQGYPFNISLDSEYVNPANFKYRGVDVNRPTFKADSPVGDDFLPEETLSLNNVVIRLTVTVTWNEQQNLPVSVSAMTFRADFQRRTG
ncbi:MAG: type IV pilus modification PilV family protein [Candidatus Rifleibacteriota bacterium]